MSESNESKVGTVGWIDLTVPNASEIRDFYSKVVGWTHSNVSMGEYDDFCMLPPDSDNPSTGICHARGTNKDIPPVWMIYIIVEDLESSLNLCSENGGEVILGPKNMGESRYAMIKDPAGAVCALYQLK